MVALASAKASPGVTTTALSLAAVWPTDTDVVLAECDPAGGDLAALFGLSTTPGLLSLAPAVRRTTRSGLMLTHCQTLPGGLRVLVGPVAAEQATGALGMLPPRLLAELDRDQHAVWLADCGRLTPGSPALAMATQASLVLLVTRPVASELGHVAALLGAVGSRCRALGLVLVGDGPYGAREVASALGVRVVGVLPVDRRGVAAVSGAAGPGVRPRRLPRLLRAASEVAAGLHQDLMPTGAWQSLPPSPYAAGAWLHPPRQA